MLRLTVEQKRQIVEEFRRKERSDRKRKKKIYVTISVAEAKSLGYRPVTSSFSTRQYTQCDMLDHVILDFKDCDIRLVRIGRAKNLIEVWRKMWDRQRPPKIIKRVLHARMTTPSFSGFIEALIEVHFR